jgi:hypothetical protein
MPGARLRFRFSFNALHENAVIIYDADTLERIVDRANAFRVRDDDWEFENHARGGTALLITAWHKDASWNPSLPWFQSRMKVFVETDKVVSLGFEDAPGAADFDDAVVTVNIWPPPPPPPPPPPARRARQVVGIAAIFVAGVALGLRILRPANAPKTDITTREGSGPDD